MLCVSVLGTFPAFIFSKVVVSFKDISQASDWIPYWELWLRRHLYVCEREEKTHPEYLGCKGIRFRTFSRNRMSVPELKQFFLRLLSDWFGQWCT
uniref:Secreted protein n=1 Tax=Panstrongylus lignarius TaxID=156445 RepID=A0A224Y2Z2_9HEMI